MRFVALLLLCLPMALRGQDSLRFTSRKYVDRNSILVGMGSAGGGYRAVDPATQAVSTASTLTFSPRLGYFPLRSVALGVSGMYGWTSGNAIAHYRYYGLGGFGRFYLFMRGRDRLLDPRVGTPGTRRILFGRTSPASRNFLALRMFPFVEAAFDYTNLTQDSVGNTVVLDRMSAPGVYGFLGFNARILHHLHLEIAWGVGYYPDRPARFQFQGGGRLGIDYILPFKANQYGFTHADVRRIDREPRPTKFSADPDTAHSPRIVVGTSLTYIWDDVNNHLREYTWALNVAYSPVRKLYVGLNSLNIWMSSDSTARTRFNVFGAFAQYHLGKKRLYFYPEAGFYRGDYCTCGLEDPYRRKGINYLAIGGGFGYKLYRGLELEFAFLTYNPLGLKALNAYSYTQYVLGLNYEFRLGKGIP